VVFAVCGDKELIAARVCHEEPSLAQVLFLAISVFSEKLGQIDRLFESFDFIFTLLGRPFLYSPEISAKTLDKSESLTSNVFKSVAKSSRRLLKSMICRSLSLAKRSCSSTKRRNSPIKSFSISVMIYLLRIW
jgi:hypothetical protein